MKTLLFQELTLSGIGGYFVGKKELEDYSKGKKNHVDKSSNVT